MKHAHPRIVKHVFCAFFCSIVQPVFRRSDSKQGSLFLLSLLFILNLPASVEALDLTTQVQVLGRNSIQQDSTVNCPTWFQNKVWLASTGRNKVAWQACYYDPATSTFARDTIGGVNQVVDCESINEVTTNNYQGAPALSFNTEDETLGVDNASSGYLRTATAYLRAKSPNSDAHTQSQFLFKGRWFCASSHALDPGMSFTDDYGLTWGEVGQGTLPTIPAALNNWQAQGFCSFRGHLFAQMYAPTYGFARFLMHYTGGTGNPANPTFEIVYDKPADFLPGGYAGGRLFYAVDLGSRVVMRFNTQLYTCGFTTTAGVNGSYPRPSGAIDALPSGGWSVARLLRHGNRAFALFYSSDYTKLRVRSTSDGLTWVDNFDIDLSLRADLSSLKNARSMAIADNGDIYLTGGQSSTSDSGWLFRVLASVSGILPNTAPVVSAGSDLAVTLPDTASLQGTVSDDGVAKPAVIWSLWSKVSGPGSVTFAAPTSPATTASFSLPGTYVLRLSAHDGTLSSQDDVQVTVAGTYPVVPTITDISPISGDTTGGTPITITGALLNGATSVTVGGVAATAVTAVSENQITCTTPAHAEGNVNVVVTASSGVATSTGGFTYMLPPPTFRVYPFVSPVNGSILGGTVVTVSGTNFLHTKSVVVGGAPATGVTVVNNNTVTFVTAPHPDSSTLPSRIVLTTPSGSVVGEGFNYLTPAATISTITPATGNSLGGTAVIITGSNLATTTTSSVKFGGTAASSVVVVSDTTITCTAPVHAVGVVDVALTTYGGTVTKTGGFTYALGSAPLPAVSPLSPNVGSTAGGVTMYIFGSFLTGISSVTFGGVAATAVTFYTDTFIGCKTPAHAAGVVDVVVTTSGGSTTLTGGYTYQGNPVITSVAPATGGADGGGSVTITGSNLLATSSVTFGGASATSVTVVDATHVTCRTPAHAAGLVDVGLTATGSGTNTGAFTYQAGSLNTAPTVNAGTNQMITLPGNAVILNGTASDDGLPIPAALPATWSKLSGPGTVSFSDAESLTSTATFSMAGTYVLGLTANDGALATTGTVQITVAPIPTPYDIWTTSTGLDGTPGNEAGAMDDPDHDGSANFLEYATGMNPKAKDIVPCGSSINGANIEFIYSKNKSATDTTFIVEWSDTLGNDWSTTGVSTPNILSDNGVTQQIKVTLPAGNGVPRRFVHLKVTKP